MPNEKGQYVDESNNNGLHQNILFRTNLKMADPHNSGLAQRIFLKFCRMKGANRYMKMIIIFLKKKIGGKWTILGPKMMHPHNSGFAVRIFFFTFCTMKSANSYMKVIIMVRTKKISSNGPFWIRKWHILVTLDQV